MQAVAIEDRPPYVQFEVRAVEDRSRTIAEGAYACKDVLYAVITPIGAKDRVERVASEWFDNLNEQVKQGRFPAQWLEHYKAAKVAFERDMAPPLNGTDINNWPLLSPAQRKTLLALQVRTVEDMSSANSETLDRIGMGSHDLKVKAKAWLDANKGGKVAEVLSALQAENKDLKDQITRSNEKISELEQAISSIRSNKK